MHVPFKIHYRNNLIDKKDSYLIPCPPSWDDRNYIYGHQLYPSGQCSIFCFLFLSLMNLTRSHMFGLVLGVWCLTPLSTIFQFYRDGQFYWLKNPEYPEKTTDLPQVTDKLDHISCIEYITPWSRLELTTLVVIGTNCTGSCKSNCFTIMTTATPNIQLKCLHLKSLNCVKIFKKSAMDKRKGFAW